MNSTIIEYTLKMLSVVALTLVLTFDEPDLELAIPALIEKNEYAQ